MPRRSPTIEDKRWTTTLEAEVLEAMQAEPTGHVDPIDPPEEGEVFAIDTPPPYPSGTWHIGAVAHYALIDVIARSSRMRGYNVLFPWGVDRNGINIEQVVEKDSGKPLQQWDRAEFNAACREAIQQNTDDLEAIAKRVAMSANFEDPYYTDSPEYRAMSQAGFIELFENGAIVEDLRPNNYDPSLGTSIADAEVYYEERETDLVHVTWTVQETQDELVIATTRPELICACQAVLVHPDDERYSHLAGKHAVLPLYDRTVEILANPHVDPEFGSGTMMVCSFGDKADVQLFRELDLEPVKAIDTDGCMTEAAGPYAGLPVDEAKAKIKEDLAEQGLVAEIERVQQTFPISERSKAPVEIVLLKEWYVKQTDAIDELRSIAKDMAFHPPKHRQILLDWIDTVTIDWPISRRRYYHTEIPLWYLAEDPEQEAELVVLPPPGPYYQPWQDEPPGDAIVYDRTAREQLGTLEDYLEEHPNLELVGETKVFDTWMDSSQSNLFILGWHQEESRAFFEENFPCSLRPQGRDIVRTWLYYTALKSHLLEGAKPFEHVWISGLGMDKHGRKMSKSLGNVIEPTKILDIHGADAFRFWIASECTVGDDYRISEDRIQGARKFITKLYNVARFVSMFPRPDEPATELAPVNGWIRAEFNELRERCLAGYEDLNFFQPANAIRDFIWNLFAPHYMEMVKHRAYDDDAGTIHTLHEVLLGTVQLLAPISPIVAYKLYSELEGGDVHATTFPEPLDGADEGLAELTEQVTGFNSHVWGEKKDQGISLRDGISGIPVPDELMPLTEDLVAMHGLEDA